MLTAHLMFLSKPMVHKEDYRDKLEKGFKCQIKNLGNILKLHN